MNSNVFLVLQIFLQLGTSYFGKNKYNFLHFSGSECIPKEWKCDHTVRLTSKVTIKTQFWPNKEFQVDCHDKSDEDNCENKKYVFSDDEAKSDSIDMNSLCSDEEFACSPHDCIPISWICDSAIDCYNGKDEEEIFCR